MRSNFNLSCLIGKTIGYLKVLCEADPVITHPEKGRTITRRIAKCQCLYDNCGNIVLRDMAGLSRYFRGGNKVKCACDECVLIIKRKASAAKRNPDGPREYYYRTAHKTCKQFRQWLTKAWRNE